MLPCKNAVLAAFAAAGGIAAYLFGPWDALLVALLAAIVLDYLTGVAVAAVQRTLSSAVGWRGLLKKAVILLIVCLGTLLDRLLEDSNGAVRAAVCLFYIANEGLSVLENAGALGLPLPETLKRALARLQPPA
jgi:toxin secretion/phage lysis holin